VLVMVGVAGRGVVVLRAGTAGVRALPLTGPLRLIAVGGAGVPGAIVRRWAVVALIVAPPGDVTFRASPRVALAMALWPTPLRTPHRGILGRLCARGGGTVVARVLASGVARTIEIAVAPVAVRSLVAAATVVGAAVGTRIITAP
jgi:hypothetical protein